MILIRKCSRFSKSIDPNLNASESVCRRQFMSEASSVRSGMNWLPMARWIVISERRARYIQLSVSTIRRLWEDILMSMPLNLLNEVRKRRLSWLASPWTWWLRLTGQSPPPTRRLKYPPVPPGTSFPTRDKNSPMLSNFFARPVKLSLLMEDGLLAYEFNDSNKKEIRNYGFTGGRVKLIRSSDANRW